MMTNAEIQHMAIMERNLGRIADALEGKAETVWVGVVADPNSDEPDYVADAAVFAVRDVALEFLRNSAFDDAQAVKGDIRWYDECTDEPWCQVCRPDGSVFVTHMLKHKTVIRK